MTKAPSVRLATLTKKKRRREKRTRREGKVFRGGEGSVLDPARPFSKEKKKGEGGKASTKRPRVSAYIFASGVLQKKKEKEKREKGINDRTLVAKATLVYLVRLEPEEIEKGERKENKRETHEAGLRRGSCFFLKKKKKKKKKKGGTGTGEGEKQKKAKKKKRYVL